MESEDVTCSDHTVQHHSAVLRASWALCMGVCSNLLNARSGARAVTSPHESATRRKQSPSLPRDQVPAVTASPRTDSGTPEHTSRVGKFAATRQSRRAVLPSPLVRSFACCVRRLGANCCSPWQLRLQLSTRKERQQSLPWTFPQALLLQSPWCCSPRTSQMVCLSCKWSVSLRHMSVSLDTMSLCPAAPPGNALWMAVDLHTPN